MSVMKTLPRRRGAFSLRSIKLHANPGPIATLHSNQQVNITKLEK